MGQGALMASVTAEYHYGDGGDFVVVMVDVENDYPDCLAQAKAVAVEGVKDLTGIGTEREA
jgi:hypothetical protein